ncbi:TetR family transcriptional regulator [Actinocrispum sp. NPDC049592]|uniref:TetR family transcriptional regulator n=1 Tax=Actinocrispum sp. NPDC049592 TaxID=3154835 RepID=UPI00344030E1
MLGRRQCGWARCQREFAARAGMDPTALSKVLHGTRRLRDDELVAIAREGKVSQRYLRTGEGRGPGPAKGRARADSLDPDIRRAQILEATARLVARKGFHHVRVADIAEECGTSTGTIHYQLPHQGRHAAVRARFLRGSAPPAHRGPVQHLRSCGG